MACCQVLPKTRRRHAAATTAAVTHHPDLPAARCPTSPHTCTPACTPHKRGASCPGKTASRPAPAATADDDVSARVELVDGADGGQIRVHQLLHQCAVGCAHQVDGVQGRAPIVLCMPRVSGALVRRVLGGKAVKEEEGEGRGAFPLPLCSTTVEVCTPHSTLRARHAVMHHGSCPRHWLAHH